MNDRMPAFSPVTPRAEFVHKLGREIGHAARERVGYGALSTWDRRVVELRRLVRLLRRTLVPVQPRPAFRQSLAAELRADALRVTVSQPRRLRWLVIGSAIGSLLSLVGVLMAILLKQRRTQAQHRSIPATSS